MDRGLQRLDSSASMEFHAAMGMECAYVANDFHFMVSRYPEECWVRMQRFHYPANKLSSIVSYLVSCRHYHPS
jgi:hypothetical protein